MRWFSLVALRSNHVTSIWWPPCAQGTGANASIFQGICNQHSCPGFWTFEFYIKSRSRSWIRLCGGSSCLLRKDPCFERWHLDPCLDDYFRYGNRAGKTRSWKKAFSTTYMRCLDSARHLWVCVLGRNKLGLQNVPSFVF